MFSFQEGDRGSKESASRGLFKIYYKGELSALSSDFCVSTGTGMGSRSRDLFLGQLTDVFTLSHDNVLDVSRCW